MNEETLWFYEKLWQTFDKISKKIHNKTFTVTC